MRRSACIKHEPIVRARLLDTLAGAPRFTHMRAPAGFGKSTLLSQFRRQRVQAGERVLSIDLSPGSEASTGLLETIAFAGNLPEGGDYRALVDALRGSSFTVLLIDNADHLGRTADARTTMARLIADCPELRFVFASRGETGLPLARHEMSGELLRIPPRALLFDDEEQEAFLAQVEQEGGTFSPHRESPLWSDLAGWPVGLGLQARIGAERFQPDQFGRGHPETPAIKGTWRLVGDYFEQEVMSALGRQTCEFLVRASVLEHLDVEDCQALFEYPCEDLAQLAYRQGAPLWPTDPEHRSYAMLPIFRQFLRGRLEQEEAASLGARASELLERRGDYRGASMLALEFGDQGRAAEMVERQMQADFGLRDETTLLALADRIDHRVRDKHPRIVLAQCQALIFRFEFEQARRLLDKARALVEAKAKLNDGDREEVRSLEMLLLHREMVLALGQHDLSAAQGHGDRLLSDMEDMPPMQRVMLLNSLTYAKQELYIFHGAERYYAQAKKLIPMLDSWIWSIPLETFYARHLYQTGRTRSAIDLLEATLGRLTQELGPRPIFGAIAAIALAEMKFDTAAIDEADDLLRDYSDKIEQFGFLSLIVAARVTQARIHMARGEFDAGFAVLERPTVSAGELFDKLSHALSVERAYWLLRLGRADEAKQACAAVGLSLATPPDPHGSSGTSEEAYTSAWIQMARAARRLEDAIQVAQKWQRYTEGVGAVRSNVRWHVILASLRSLSEEPALAMRHLRRAIRLGTVGEYRAAFRAEAEVLHAHLAVLTDSDLEESERNFVRSIIGLPPRSQTADERLELPSPVGALSARDMAILRLVAKGQMNREIGATLGMSEGTVKWYLHKIYGILGIRRRSQVAMLMSQWHARATRGEETPSGNDDQAGSALPR